MAARHAAWSSELNASPAAVAAMNLRMRATGSDIQFLAAEFCHELSTQSRFRDFESVCNINRSSVELNHGRDETLGPPTDPINRNHRKRQRAGEAADVFRRCLARPDPAALGGVLPDRRLGDAELSRDGAHGYLALEIPIGD